MVCIDRRMSTFNMGETKYISHRYKVCGFCKTPHLPFSTHVQRKNHDPVYVNRTCYVTSIFTEEEARNRQVNFMSSYWSAGQINASTDRYPDPTSDTWDVFYFLDGPFYTAGRHVAIDIRGRLIARSVAMVCENGLGMILNHLSIYGYSRYWMTQFFPLCNASNT